ncbi:MAG: DUF4835 family protein [Sporocytophaga sp.]|uniref:type IX secretion system protein PorD n=1 Tax=Sporocytophaga sp. TaxID=2231183 RepID=UPI001B249F64|nr:DUF4835 family protein [Sporocytophaga sp.]MBO9700220.1 DUF4835 family protein [Sporocytophaga sp.]
MKKYLIALIFILTNLISFAQQGELNCTITIDAESIENSEKKDVMTQLKAAMLEFMNNKRWTTDEYKPEERINCNIIITLTGVSGQSLYEATAMITSTRPLYNTNKETMILKFLDRKFNFEYVEGSAIYYTENSFNGNLTAMLSYYAYMILAMDYDTFGQMGGTKYYEKARDIANIAQSSQAVGWDQLETNGRFSLIQNLTNTQFAPFREGLYIYHRQAMDKFLINADQSRKDIITVFDKIKTVYNINPTSVVIKNFFNAKVEEIINIYSQATPEMRQQVVNTLRQMDPLNADKYNRLLKL